MLRAGPPAAGTITSPSFAQRHAMLRPSVDHSDTPAGTVSDLTTTGNVSGADHRPSVVRVKTCNRSEEHTSELQSRQYLVCRLLLEKKKKINTNYTRSLKQRIVNDMSIP